ncbi:uncharacterized protein TEOVI_000856900 [Trypanosoma equiperdum]|uniref:Uncharacterized protein n=2 Tax=Trypanozoon TaxID=39700 RepID=Q4GYF1_TRYB2|nr:hypothetical protein, unlikely [Trypanosoma brucei brucei TREU927]CAJ16633.1 hypothetical protein, unlikely [Trypanosoma brucei brucei TREU927]SCU67540.1 hypothetical protein, conserved [Trypanosoma equiperdum]
MIRIKERRRKEKNKRGPISTFRLSFLQFPSIKQINAHKCIFAEDYTFNTFTIHKFQIRYCFILQLKLQQREGGEGTNKSNQSTQIITTILVIVKVVNNGNNNDVWGYVRRNNLTTSW